MTGQRMHPRKVSSRDAEYALMLRELGRSYSQIAEMLGYRTRAVRRAVAQLLDRWRDDPSVLRNAPPAKEAAPE